MGEFVAKNGTSGLYLQGGSPLAYTKIPGVTAFDPGQVQTEELDATDFDSAAGYKEYDNGLKDFQEGSITCWFSPGDTTQEAIRTAIGGAAKNFKAVYDSKQLVFDALVKGESKPIQVGTRSQITFTIKMTGAPTWENVT